MEHGFKLMEYVAGALIFCAGAAFLFFGYKNMLTVTRTLQRTIDDGVVYEQGYLQDYEAITDGEIVALLCQPLEHDIKIDGFIIKKEEHTSGKIADYKIEDTTYQKTCLYDGKGNITIVQFDMVR